MGVRFGRYELLRPLGRGGMAEVFLARYVGPEGFEKRLVIKRVLPKLADDRRLLRMFFEEARTQVSLSHGNLVPVFDFGRVGNEYFIAMEHVRGADLGTLLAAEHAAGRRLPPLLVAQVGIEVGRALAYVHRRGFVHRDVSPRNVLLSTDGEVKLSDFGLVLAAASEAAPGVRGTLAYMPPEQARGERVDGRTDVYALGLVLAEAVRGERVRPARDEEEALAIARAGVPVRVEGPLAEVVARATATAPAARYAGAEEMTAALEAVATALGGGREAAARDLAERVTRAAPAATSVASGDAAPATVTLGSAATHPGASAAGTAASLGAGAATASGRGGDGGGASAGAGRGAPLTAGAGDDGAGGASATGRGGRDDRFEALAAGIAARPEGGSGSGRPGGAAGGETYFRDRRSVAFVDEVLGGAPAAVGRRRAVVIAAPVLLLLGALGGAALLARRGSGGAPARASDLAPLPPERAAPPPVAALTKPTTATPTTATPTTATAPASATTAAKPVTTITTAPTMTTAATPPPGTTTGGTTIAPAARQGTPRADAPTVDVGSRAAPVGEIARGHLATSVAGVARAHVASPPGASVARSPGPTALWGRATAPTPSPASSSRGSSSARSSSALGESVGAPTPPGATAAHATLHVRCTPWCVAAVDGARHGQDGRDHLLTVSVGRHRIEALRLDDHLERTVDVHPGDQTVDFSFD